MSNPNGDKGAKAERDVAKYLAGWWPMARRALGAGRKDDRGDIHGIPLTVVQVKDCETLRLPKWVDQTLTQRENDDAPLCLLVVKKRYKAVPEWDAYMPLCQLGQPFEEREVRSWTRMDLGIAVRLLRFLIEQEVKAMGPSPSGLSYSTTEWN